MVTKGLNKITQNETQDPQLVDNFCKSWDIEENIDIVAFEHKKSSITTANFMVRPSGLEPPTPTMSR